MRKWLVPAAVVGALLWFLVGRAKSEGGGAKFKVGDRITYKVLAPENVVYQVTAINLGRMTYLLSQVFQGQLVNPDEYSISAIDANYVLV